MHEAEAGRAYTPPLHPSPTILREKLLAELWHLKQVCSVIPIYKKIVKLHEFFLVPHVCVPIVHTVEYAYDLHSLAYI